RWRASWPPFASNSTNNSKPSRARERQSHPHQGRARGPDVRKGRAEQAGGQGHGRIVLRGDPDRPGKGRDGETLGVRQLPTEEEAAAPGPQPEDRGGNTHHRAARRHLSREPKAEEPGGEVLQWPWRTWRRLTSRPSPPSAISRSAKLANCAG